MTKHMIIAAIASLAVLGASSLSAIKVTVENKSTDNIQVFFRGEGAKIHHTVVISGDSGKGGNIGTYDLTPAHLESKDFMEVIASKGNQGSPDWKLLGGTCKHMSTSRDHTVVVEDAVMGLKTTCKLID